MTRYLAVLLFATFSLAACDSLETKETGSEIKKKKSLEPDDEDLPTKKKVPLIGDEVTTNSAAEILNNIIVHESGGLKVSRAFLSFEDGALVPKNNHAPLNTAVYLQLAIEGWKTEDGMVSLNAWEKILTDKGELVLNAQDLFKETPQVEESKANMITLQAGITRTRTDIRYFLVQYRVWDRKGKGEVKGSYKLYVGDAETDF